MLSNVGGSLLVMAVIGLGLGTFYVALVRTRALENVRFNNGWRIAEVRKYYKYIVAIGLVVAAIAGWFVGPYFFDSFGAVP